MSVNFAGARNVDERRRRRISQTTDVQPTPIKNGKGIQRGMIPKSLVSAPELMPESPVHALIPKTPWKFWTILGVTFLLWLTFSSIGICYELLTGMNDYGFSRFFNLQNGTFWSCWTIGCLIVSAQLSWVIYWYRSHGTDDFQGYYKAWLWTACACSLVAFLMSTEIGYIISQQFGRKVHLYNQQMIGMIWLAALYAVGIELTRKIDQELGECRTAYIFLVCFITTSLVGTWIVLTKQNNFLELHPYAWMTLSHSLISFFLLATIYSFTHRTLYITANAATRRSSPVFKFILHAPKLTWYSSKRAGTSMKQYSLWFIGLFTRSTESTEEETASTKKSKKSTKKTATAKSRKPAPNTKRRKIKEVIEEETTDEEVAEDSEEYVDESYDEEAVDESAEDSSEEEYAEEETVEKFDEEAWLKAELEREEQLKKQAQQERQQQKNNSGKPKFRLDTPAKQQSPHNYQKEEEEQYEEPQSNYNSYNDNQNYNKQSQDNYSQDEDGDDDNQNSGGYDPEMFKGLSKREKRKLKQQLRDQERQNGKR